MSHLDEIFKEMESLLIKLIDNAEKLVAISSQVFSEQDIKSLQAVQEKLLGELGKLDKACKGKDSTRQKNIDALLKKFEGLNSRFMDNLASNHRVINFKK